MDRLSALRALALMALLSGASCDKSDEQPSLAPAERSQVVQEKATAVNAAAPVPAPLASPAAPKAHRALCGGRLDSEGKGVPKRAISRRAASGVAELSEDPPLGGGFTWVNFWAAWCVPCREEIPRLLGWQKKLGESGKAFRVVFVSLDDDERQLEKFLAEQPAGGLQATYWLRDGKERDDWLGAAGVDSDPELPEHLLVDARGKIRCRVRGAVEDADYPDLVGLLGG